jgi:hypothetical protein
MGRHDHLRFLPRLDGLELLQELELAIGRERRFRLVEDEDTGLRAAFLEEADEAFAM